MALRFKIRANYSKKMLICTPIQVKTQKEAKKQLKILAGKVDMAEIWLDHIKDLDIDDLLKVKTLPVICVCKKENDKGKFKGSYKEASEVLIQAIKSGTDYIDIPLLMPKELNKKIVQVAKKHKVKIIISHHNFTKTPSISMLIKKAIDMQKRGASIVKIAVMAKSLSDTVAIISLAKQLESKGIKHILIAMGRVGALSRVLTPTLGGDIMFAPIEKKKGSAPGQISVKELKEAWSLIKK